MDMRSLWFKDKDGKPDPVLTFAFLSVVVVLAKMLFAGATVKLFGGAFLWTITSPDATTIAAAWIPTLGAYVSNKYVNYNYHPDYVRMKKDIDGDGDEEEVLIPRDSAGK